MQSSLQLKSQSEIIEELYQSDDCFKVMCEMFLRDDELMTKHQIYQVYKNNTAEECFEKLSNFYNEIESNRENEFLSPNDDPVEEEI
jgi:hypothetical protein